MSDLPALLTGWGRTAPTAAHLVRPASVSEIAGMVHSAGARGVLARGLGRSYGDAAQNAGGLVLDLCRLDAIGPIDDATGELTCGAGVSVDALLRRSVPAGWFVPVTPGTRQVSLGGAVAADVHGKNHHRDGSFGQHVSRLDLVDGLGNVRTLTPRDDLFWATVGGMGLTGLITSVTVRMIPVQSAWIAVDTVRTAGLDDTMAGLADCDTRRRYSVAWIDCLATGAALGRGVITAGDHLPAAGLTGAAAAEPLRFSPRTRLAAPRWAPRRLLDRMQVAAFNEAYFRRTPRRSLDVPIHSAAFFHPLDAIDGWNRLYGRPGFVQYQFATPDAATVPAVLRSLQATGAPGLLAVLKRFGPGNRAPLSFPTAGWTLAVDIPARVPGLGAVLDAADRRVLASGGRVYLAKDARIAPDVLAAMYPGLDRWREVRAAADPHGVFTSDLARRLHL
jgi:decaprenylphospho-beta-D-ribofuranose 2-oxidase